MTYASRVGISVVHIPMQQMKKLKYRLIWKIPICSLNNSDLLRLDNFSEEADEGRLIEGIRKLISHEVVR